jgi:hypothetical protein
MRQMMMTSIAVSLLALAGCGGIDDTGAADDPEQQTEPLIGAPLDATHTWSVGVCAGPLNEDPAAGPIGACLSAGTRCTGTLVAPDLVLTARHCVHEIDYSNATDFCTGVFTDTPLSDAPVHVTTAKSVLGADIPWRAVSEVLTSPVTDASCAGDLVLLRLAQDIPAKKAKPVTVDLRNLVQTQPGQVAIVGRGVIEQLFDIETYEVIHTVDGGLRRRVLEHIPFECVSNTAGVCSAPDIGATFFPDTGYFMIGFGAASGDSGSGIVRQWSFDAEQPRVIGVQSAGTVDPVTGIPNFGFGVRLDRHAKFLKKHLSCGANGLCQGS